MKWLTLLLILVPFVAEAQLAATLPVAKGAYRMPYDDGIEVEITRDHTNHGNNDPANGTLGVRNRMDMVGLPRGAPHLLVAAADGWVRLIDDSNLLWCPNSPTNDPAICDGEPNCCERDDPTCNSGCANNYVWMEHPNGEWTKYSHPRVGSVTLLGPDVGEFVAAGTVLGIEGKVGLASGQHLHFEVARPRQRIGTYDPEDTSDPNHPIDPDGFLEFDGEVTDPSYHRDNRVIFFCQLGLLLDNDVVTSVACDGLCGNDNDTISGTTTDDDTDYVQVTNALVADGYTVDSGGGLAVRGGDSVTLLPGFTAQANSYFSASVNHCDDPGT